MIHSLRIARWSALFAFIFFCTSIYPRRDEYCPPRLTIVIVVDALPYACMLKYQAYFQGGFRKLLEKGIVYNNAYWPHGICETATGHTALNTGTFAKDHGVISNSWPMGNCKVDVDFDQSPKAAVFSPDGFYDYGLSPHRIMTDGVSDVLMLNSEPNSRKQMYAISLKSRAAIGSANKLGKAIWFDEKGGQLTSSKAYYDKLPEWLVKFNEKENIANLKSVRWDLCTPIVLLCMILIMLIIMNSANKAALSLGKNLSSIVRKSLPMRCLKKCQSLTNIYLMQRFHA